MKKVAVIGPESTGKSTLCRLLADHFHTEWCPEYAREYLHVHGARYHKEDLPEIAKGQLNLEDTYIRNVSAKENETQEPVLFIDTEMYVMKVWSEFVFGECHPFILNEVAKRKYDLYLLCDIDLPWEDDELREYPEEKPRQELFRIYHDILLNQSTPWVLINGSYEERLKKAIEAVKLIMNYE